MHGAWCAYAWVHVWPRYGTCSGTGRTDVARKVDPELVSCMGKLVRRGRRILTGEIVTAHVDGAAAQDL